MDKDNFGVGATAVTVTSVVSVEIGIEWHSC